MATPRLTADASGVFTIAVTPFTDDGRLDLDSTDRLTDFYLRQEVDGMTILGVMGEAPKLSRDESLTFLKRVIGRVGGRVPVVVGASNPGIDNLAAFARQAMAEGAAGVMVAPVPTLKTDAEVVGYFAQVFEAMGPDVPVVFQDYPQTTGVWLSVAAWGELVDRYPQLVVLKHEQCPGLRKVTRVRAAEANGQRRVSILVGNGGMHLPQELARGVDGAMTGFAFPEMLVTVCRLFAAGRRDEAEDVYDAYLPVLRHEYMPGLGLAIRKEILRRRGVIASSALRAPGPTLDAADHAELDGLLARLQRRLDSGGPASAAREPLAVSS